MPDGLVSVLYQGRSHIYLETPITYAFMIRVYILGGIAIIELILYYQDRGSILPTSEEPCHVFVDWIML